LNIEEARWYDRGLDGFLAIPILDPEASVFPPGVAGASSRLEQLERDEVSWRSQCIRPSW